VYVAAQHVRGRKDAFFDVQEPPEGNTAEALGMTSAAPDGTTWLLQLPPLLPSVTLVEAAERRAAAVATPGEASGAPPAAPAPAPPLLAGPEVLQALPNGRVRPGHDHVESSMNVSCTAGYAHAVAESSSVLSLNRVLILHSASACISLDACSCLQH
jgi:hypothetical protein